jgi:hypothetical protein
MKRGACAPLAGHLARGALTVGDGAGTAHDPRPNLGRVQWLVVPGAGQAERVIVGIEV